MVYFTNLSLSFRIALAKRNGLPDQSNFQKWRPLVIVLLVLTVVICLPLGLWEAFQTTTNAVTTLSILRFYWKLYYNSVVNDMNLAYDPRCIFSHIPHHLCGFGLCRKYLLFTYNPLILSAYRLHRLTMPEISSTADHIRRIRKFFKGAVAAFSLSALCEIVSSETRSYWRWIQDCIGDCIPTL
jgi:hypothetical protein